MAIPSHLLFVFLFIILTKLSYCIKSNTINFCPEIEKHSLLTFKQSLYHPQNSISSWDGEVNCCKWEGVVCNNSTGHVSQLHLTYNTYYDIFHHEGEKLNESLSNLKHLAYLDLSYNNFFGETIPSFIGSFSELEYLNLSYSGFEGKIPPHIGNLSNLHTLDLSSGSMYNLESENLEWLGGLSKLEYLNMEYANLGRANNWAEVINSLPCLLELHLRFCNIHHFQHHVNNLSTSLKLISFPYNDFINADSNKSVLIPQWFFQLKSLVSLDLSSNSFSGKIPAVSNATKLQFLDLSRNDINSTIPDWVYSCKDLRFLDLTSNSIQGQISEAIGNLTSLETLHLGLNKLSGKLPREITTLCRLQELDLSINQLQGQVEDSFGAMSDCFLGSLKVLHLSHNRLTGHLTEQFGEFQVLEHLFIQNNSLSGTLPTNLGNLPSLEYLRLNDNKLTGNLPVSLGQLSKMIKFHVHNNQLEGTVKEAHFANLSNLETFYASGNHLTLSVGLNWILPKNISTLGLGSWSLGAGSHTPSWLLHPNRNIFFLDISDAGISGSIPSWFSNILFLNVSNNNFHGKIPYIISGETYMSHNNFSGSLPRIGDQVHNLDLSHNTFYEGLSNLLCDPMYQSYLLYTLVLEGNLLSGELPDCWEKWQNLEYLNVGNNTMSGRLPNSLGSLGSLASLNLRGNKFTGQIPFSMLNCTNLLKMDLGYNNLDGNVPTWIGTSLKELKILILPANKFIGEIPWELCHLQSLQILDLSSNEISGVIPKCLHNLTAMATKRVLLHVEEDMEEDLPQQLPYMERATVATKGLELEYTSILSLVTNIDLSSNNLSGEIPKELTRLVMLGSLNLSRNQLSGSIPESIGEMKQLESVDFSRNSLSGQIPNGFTSLYSLGFLDLSFNNLSGRIPQSTQLQTMDASRYMGNDLCGPPLARNCSSDEGEEAHGHHGEETEEGKKKGEVEWIYVLLSLGYAVGFSGVCSVLVLKKSWRDAYFGLVEKILDKLYVYFHLWIQRF